MVFIIGGSYQGKTECAFRRMRNQDKKESEIGAEAFSVFDARNMKKSEKLEALPETERRQALNARRQIFQEISDSQTVLHLELLVRRLMEQDSETENWEEELFSALQDREGAEKIITADEIGYGIVPLDHFERAYREKEGRFCQRVAACAREVQRVICGVETQIK